ncbi:DNA polymerase subunit gamma-1 [Echinococcus granulosus]|uniref:Mitochondrial DNA polymerase catalytic subunit n=1 Tax=Echinococcus granulosus TaxID=6210 RepID=W6UZJ0_ECHGR|nr:DNA polymerase subunit gamma-1 [Echinococcus granulosus]EUB59079.1 DNA polymerase subunit gamma-1 [Echinococcus granulosus]
MSLHICVSGLTSTQRNLKLASDKHLYNNKLWKDFVAEHNAKRGSNDPESLDWIKDASLNSLLDVFKFYCQKEPYQNKELRAVFEKGSRGDVIDNFQALATYCANDVKMTFETFRNLWKLYQEREYLKYWTKEMEERLCGVNSRRAFETRANPDARDDLLLDELRRSVEVMPLDLDTVNHLVSSLKKISDNDRGEQVKSKNSLPPVYENLGELQAKGALFWGNKDRYETDHSVKWISASRRKKLRRSATDTINPEIPTCWFCPLPNEAGTGLPVGSPLSKPFQVHIASGRLYSSPTAGGGEDHSADQILRDRIRASFWQSYSKRVIALRNGKVPFGRRYGAILPQVIAAGTISRRAVEPLWLTASNAERERLGSEIKALVQAPPGFCLVGADVDSQEMWIASLIGDSVVGFQGGTPYGWMTLEGSKAKGTDLHTKTANLIGIKRNEAKILNYARLYGSGLEFTKHLLSKFQSNLRPEEASLKAEKLMRATKGHRVPVHMGKGCKEEAETRYIWKDGTESCVFNALEAIARSPEPRTPVLGAQITKTLTPTVVKDDFLPSRINWVVQSSAVDYLHCLLVFMAWLIKKYSLRARLCISIHDEVRYLCDQRCADQMALALQISNLLTRALFAFQLGMHDLPESVAYFSSVEVDTCLRKDPSNDCKTPSNPDGLEITYNIPKGRSFTITEIIERTGGAMEPFDSEAREPATNVI